MNSLIKDEALINFCYLTASFYNYVKTSGINFKNIISQYDKNKDDKNENTNNKIMNIEKDFDLLNNPNSMNYYENISLLNNNDEDTKKEKIKLIKSVFGDIFEENKIEKIIYSLTEKINFSMLSDKYLLVKFLSGQIIDHVFQIYELFYIIIKNNEERNLKKIQDIICDNILDEDKLIKTNKNLSKEIINLKNIIEIKNQNINNNLKMHEKLVEISKNLKKDKNKIKLDMQNFKRGLNNLQDKFKESNKLFNHNLKEYKEKNEFNDFELKKLEQKKYNEHRQSNKEKIPLDIVSKESNEIEILNNDIKELNVNPLFEKISKSEEKYEYIKNLNCQLILDKISNKNENFENKQQPNIQIRINGLSGILNKLGKDYREENNKINEN